MTAPHKVRGIKKPWSRIREVGACLKFDCKNRDIECDNCFKLNGKESYYKKELKCQEP